MACGVLAYPRLDISDYKIIQDFRRVHDELYYSVAEPHFGFVFPTENVKKDQFITEIFNKSKGVNQFDFEIRCVTVNKDSFLDYYHLLMVPDKGYSNIIKLHDKLYSDILFNCLRLDIDFIPHMGIANSKNKYEVKKWADSWNKKGFIISGKVDALTICDYTDNVLTDIESIKLK